MEPRASAWVIETANHTYWNGRGLDRGSFVEGADNALRFARFEDAEIVRCWLLERLTFTLRSAEHVWLKREIAQAVDFSCHVCGVQCDCAPNPPERAVCPDHCPDHLYDYDRMGGGHYCRNCGQPAPQDWLAR